MLASDSLQLKQGQLCYSFRRSPLYMLLIERVVEISIIRMSGVFFVVRQMPAARLMALQELAILCQHNAH